MDRCQAGQSAKEEGHSEECIFPPRAFEALQLVELWISRSNVLYTLYYYTMPKQTAERKAYLVSVVAYAQSIRLRVGC